MARIRSIKPEFPQSESMGNVSRDARLTFVMLWTLADDEGRLRGNSRMLASLLFPYDDDAPALIDSWMSELESEGCVIRYKCESNSYVQICNWLIHQKIDKPSKSKLPVFEEHSRTLANPRDLSSEDLRIKDQGSKDQGEILSAPGGAASGKPKREKVNLTVQDMLALSGSETLTDTTAAEYLAYRKSKRSPLTAGAWSVICEEVRKARMPLEDGLKLAMARGWQGFDATWLHRNGPNGRASPHDIPTAADFAGIPPVTDGAGRVIHPDLTLLDNMEGIL